MIIEQVLILTDGEQNDIVLDFDTLKTFKDILENQLSDKIHVPKCINGWHKWYGEETIVYYVLDYVGNVRIKDVIER